MPIVGIVASSDGKYPGTPTITNAFDVGSGRTYNGGINSITFTGVNTGKFSPTSYTITSTPGSLTSTVSTTLSRTNLVTNPSFETNLTGWSAVGTIGTRSTAQSKVGTASCLIAFPGGTSTNGVTYNLSNGVAVTAGDVLTFSFYLLRSADIGQVTFNFMFYASNGTTLIADNAHVNVPASQSTTGWYRASQTVIVPYGAAFAQPRIYITNAEGSGTTAFNAYIDAVLIEKSSVLGDYFDGSNTILTHQYSGTPSVAWTGTANASTSTFSGVDLSGPYSGQVTGLTSGTSYTYTVSETNSITTGSNSSSSSSVTATTVPSAPASASAVAASTTSVTITYGAISTGGSALTALVGSGTSTGDIVSSPAINLTYSGTLNSAGGTITVTGTFAASTAYTFSIVARNANGISTTTTTNSLAPNGPKVTYTNGTLYSDATYYYVAYKTAGTFTNDFVVANQTLTADILAVAGGGGGNYGGGGAGGYVNSTSQALTVGSYTVIMGAGGATGANGGNSQFGSLTAAVGGGGGGTSSAAGLNGGSGGGSSSSSAGGLSGGTGVSGQGFAGGVGAAGTTSGGGGGGGATAVGGNGTAGATSPGGNGGAGTSAFSAWGAATGTGQNVSGTYYYCGGGGASGFVGGTGGNGGGSNGGAFGAAGAGQTNTGGGSGGGGLGTKYGGGSGVVIIRYTRAQVGG